MRVQGDPLQVPIDNQETKPNASRSTDNCTATLWQPQPQHSYPYGLTPPIFQLIYSLPTPPNLHLMAGLIEPGAHVALRLPSGSIILREALPNTYVT